MDYTLTTDIKEFSFFYNVQCSKCSQVNLHTNSFASIYWTVHYKKQKFLHVSCQIITREKNLKVLNGAELSSVSSLSFTSSTGSTCCWNDSSSSLSSSKKKSLFRLVKQHFSLCSLGSCDLLISYQLFLIPHINEMLFLGLCCGYVVAMLWLFCGDIWENKVPGRLSLGVVDFLAGQPRCFFSKWADLVFHFFKPENELFSPGLWCVSVKSNISGVTSGSPQNLGRCRWISCDLR